MAVLHALAVSEVLLASARVVCFRLWLMDRALDRSEAERHPLSQWALMDALVDLLDVL